MGRLLFTIEKIHHTNGLQCAQAMASISGRAGQGRRRRRRLFSPTRHRQVPGEMFNINLVHGRAAGLSFRPSVRASIKNVG